MNKNVINATDVRNDFFKLIEEVAKTKRPVYIKKDREVLVKLEPVGDDMNKEWEEVKKLLDATRGIWAGRTEKELTKRFREADEDATKKIRDRNW